MKTFIKITIILFVFSFSGCWNMYNETAEDIGQEYNYYLVITNNVSDGKITIVKIGEDGSLNKLFEYTPYTTVASSYPAVHPTGNYLYVPHYNGVSPTDNYVVVYIINKNGSLTFLQAIPADGPYAVAVHPSGQFVYFTNELTDTISMYKVNENGTLSAIGSGSANTGDLPRGISISPSGKYLYVVNFWDNDIFRFVINDDGSLSNSAIVFTAPSTPYPNSIAFHANSQYSYITVTDTSSNSQVYSFKIENDGTLSQIDYLTVTGGYHFNRIATHPSGQYIYVGSTESSPYSIYVCQINTVNGSLNSTPLQIFQPGSTYTDIAIHPNGKYLFNSSKGGGSVSVNSIAEDGTLTRIKTYNSAEIGAVGEAYGLALIRRKK